MKKKILSVVVASALVVGLSGCSGKAPDPEPVSSWDKNSALTINKELLLKKEISVPKDPYLVNHNWTYQVNSSIENGELFKNDQIVKTFLVAHNASEIILIGEKNTIEKYKEYFIKNQVTANIKLQPVSHMIKNSNFVNILFFNKKENL